MEMRWPTYSLMERTFNCHKIVLFIIIAMVVVFFSSVVVVEAEPSVQLSLRRDWGYGGFGGDINGRFTAIAQVSSSVIRVEFYLDQSLVLNVTQPPFEWRFDTNDFPLGEHVIVVKAYNALGEEATAEVTRIFVESPIFPTTLIGIIVVVGVAVPLVLYRMGVFGGSSSLGMTQCPRCGEIFPRKWSPVHLFNSLLNTCPKCGKRFWASKLRETAEKTSVVEKKVSREDRLREEIERSKYEKEH